MQHQFLIKTLSKLGIRKFNLIKNIYVKKDLTVIMLTALETGLKSPNYRSVSREREGILPRVAQLSRGGTELGTIRLQASSDPP